MRNLKTNLCTTVVIALTCISSMAYGLSPQGRGGGLRAGNFTLECPEWYIILNQGGYSDWWMIKNVPGWYDTGPHELLSGEWAAAIYYDGVANSGQDNTAPAGTATWLTDRFICPSWNTNSAFTEVMRSAWDDPANPADGGAGTNDTGKTVISNGQVTITIDYEIADLGQVFASPMGVIADPATGVYALSARYVLLQTYTIRNDTNGPLDNMEFYQMLHGQPGDEYGPVVSTVYDSDLYPDPLLAGYVPFNPVHTVGNFRYDITLWNSPGLPGAVATWIDWVGFSSTTMPTAVGNNFFAGHSGKPASPGTHWDIESKALNGATSNFGEVAGAEMWRIGTLQSGATYSLTVVLMAGQKDCNNNGKSDQIDIIDGTSLDDNGNGIPDECEQEEFDHKMHYPQLPDPNGWDVNATAPLVLADDWMCSGSGFVEKIHFWGSWMNGTEGQITSFQLSIHADIPANDPNNPTGYSMPGVLLWERDIDFTNVVVEVLALPPDAHQGWFDPMTGAANYPDHDIYYKYTIHLPREDWYLQNEGVIYWLDISTTVAGPEQWGWKSSLNHWNDDSVWAEEPFFDWDELYQPPNFDQSLDLAFVIAGDILYDFDHKMHYPMLPDETGWDVNATYPKVLADDWMCSETGWVKDLHFWGSWHGGMQGQIDSFVISFHEDLPVGHPDNPTDHSMPGQLLWEEQVSWENVEATNIGPTTPPIYEGWYDPNTGTYEYDDHDNYWQYDIYFPDFLPRDRWFWQYKDTIYWLNITANTTFGEWGWKSSEKHWNDDAVWTDAPIPPPPTSAWVEMYEPPEVKTDIFFATFDPNGVLLNGGGSGYNGGTWYYYQNTDWWNQWFYDHPFDPRRQKVIHIEFDVTTTTTALGFLTLAANWSSPQWSVGNPSLEPPLPPLDPAMESLYINRFTLLDDAVIIPGTVQPYVFSYVIPDYNPEWVSIDVRGSNFEITNGQIVHSCIQSMDLAFVITGDPYEFDHKMHFPQMPDETGWDVNATLPKVLADDWQCSESGYVSEVHFWGSWEGGAEGQIQSFDVSIHEDLPVGHPQNPNTYSMPGTMLWQEVVDFSNINAVKIVPNSEEGWYDPNSGAFWFPDHFDYWQYDIYFSDILPDLADLFFQYEGTIYWLNISANVTGGQWGWKSSKDHWNDDAVWADFPVLDWIDLYEPPGFLISLDLAFVISGPSCPQPGDVNEDGSMNGDDIQCFVDCMLYGPFVSPTCNCICCDMEPDSDIDMADMAAFVAALLAAP